MPSLQKNFSSGSVSTVKPRHVIVCPLTDGHTASDEPHEKITEPQSNPLGQSESVVHSMPQNEPVWPSPMNVRQCPVEPPHDWPPLQSWQSRRPLIVEHVPAVASQNWFTAHELFSRQKLTHWPIWHAFF